MVTLQELKGYLQIPESVTTYDTKLSYILSSTIERVQKYCGRHFERATTTERIALKGGFGFLSNTPLISITSVVDDDGYPYGAKILDVNTGEITIDFLTNRDYTFTYEGGLLAEDIPSDIKLAIMQWCEFIYNNQAGVRKFSVSGYTNETSVTASGMPLEVEATLKAYKHTRLWLYEKTQYI